MDCMIELNEQKCHCWPMTVSHSANTKYKTEEAWKMFETHRKNTNGYANSTWLMSENEHISMYMLYFIYCALLIVPLPYHDMLIYRYDHICICFGVSACVCVLFALRFFFFVFFSSVILLLDKSTKIICIFCTNCQMVNGRFHNLVFEPTMNAWHARLVQCQWPYLQHTRKMKTSERTIKQKMNMATDIQTHTHTRSHEFPNH